MPQEKALIAMSGGVDSSVAACLVKQAGYACIGATMRLVDDSLLPEDMQSSCCSLDDVEDARSVAYRLGMPFYVFNYKDAFRQDVVEHFVRCYEEGGTPNPCLQCNKHLKFRHLMDRAFLMDCSHTATGHYARIRKADNGRFLLYRAVDQSKDQSYFLACLDQKQLAHSLFPLGELTKEEVRKIAEEQGFLNARKRDSQDICFIPDGDYMAFLKRYTKKAYPCGDFLDLSGKVVGKHNGTPAYTIGQRKGLGVALGQPVYVCSKDVERNTVTLGPDEALYQRELTAADWNWIPFPILSAPLRITAKIRYRHKEQPATIYPEENGTCRVVFDEPQRAITPGQAVVLYDGDMVVGSGTIL